MQENPSPATPPKTPPRHRHHAAPSITPSFANTTFDLFGLFLARDSSFTFSSFFDLRPFPVGVRPASLPPLLFFLFFRRSRWGVRWRRGEVVPYEYVVFDHHFDEIAIIGRVEIISAALYAVTPTTKPITLPNEKECK